MSHKKSKSSDVEKKTEEFKKEDPAILEVKKKNVLKNVSKQHHRIYGSIVKPGAIYEVSESDSKQETATKRIDNAVKQGYLERL